MNVINLFNCWEMKILKTVELNAHEIECVSGGCLLEYVVKKTIEELFRNISGRPCF